MAEIKSRIEYLKESLKENFDHNTLSLLLHYQRRLDLMIQEKYIDSIEMDD